MEPTFKQHNILEEINEEGHALMTGKEDEIEKYWELVRAGYLKNLIVMRGPYEWEFKLTEKAEDYLEVL